MHNAMEALRGIEEHLDSGGAFALTAQNARYAAYKTRRGDYLITGEDTQQGIRAQPEARSGVGAFLGLMEHYAERVGKALDDWEAEAPEN